MKSHDPIRSEQRLLEALRAAETATLALRDYAATVLLPGPPAAGDPSIGEEAPARVELLEDGWLAVTLEAVLPRRGDGDRSRFLAHSLRAAIRRAFPDRLPPKFHICVLAYEHIYGPGRRFLDHDNLELKHCQDVLEAAFLTNEPGCAGGGVPHQRYLRPLLRLPVQPPGRTERHPHLGPARRGVPQVAGEPSGVLGRTTGNLKQ